MIPREVDEATTSSAERRLFLLLQQDPDTRDWVVLHSLGLAARENGPYGEIDFVVLMPQGMVVCLEVKGGRVSCEAGVWQTTDRTGKISELKRSPFMQAREGMFALRAAVQRKFGISHAASGCLFVSAVVFPDVSPPPQTIEFEPWEVIGREDLSFPVSRSILRAVAGQSRKLGFTPRGDLGRAMKEVRQFLRPDFERVVVRPGIIARSEQSLVSLTEDQYHVLDTIEDNDRCLIEGAAGTGKTVLALEYARRCSRKGQRTLLLCFNRLLGDWLAVQTADSGNGGVVSGSYFRFLRNLIQSSSHRAEFEQQELRGPSNLFSEVYPFFGQLAAEEAGARFDTLVLDEAQDLLNPSTLDVLGVLLKGGMAGGRWHLFGDFTQQSIYGSSSREEKIGHLKSVCSHCTYARLVMNCRNTRRIGEEIALLSGFPSPPFRLGLMDGLAVDYRYWKTAPEQSEKLSEVVRRLLEEGLMPQELVILSARRFPDSVASSLSCRVRGLGHAVVACEVRNASAMPEGSSIAFATVHAFKGMESPTVIYCDVDHVDAEKPQSLLYVGMSRARSHLVMMVHERVRESIGKALVRKLGKEWQA
jgi:hypothetical protein